MSVYLNQVIKRTSPMTRCQCAVLAVMNEEWATTDTIWKRKPIYCDNKFGRTREVAYGTISQILAGLVQQGFVLARYQRRKQYRRNNI